MNLMEARLKPYEKHYDYAHVPTIRDFSNSDARIRGLMGCFGSGKSSGCVMEIVKRGMEQEPAPDGIRRSRWAVIRNTYPQLRDTTIRTLTDWLPERHFGNFKQAEMTYMIDQFEDTEIEILFRALDRPEHVANLLSLELTGAWFNEAREIPWAVIEAMEGRIGRFPAKAEGGATWYGIIMDTNPPDTDSRWYEYFEEKCPDDARLWKQPSGLSPLAENLANLPDNYYINLAKGKKDGYIKVYVNGEYGYVQDGKPVYGEDYNDVLHCREFNLIKDAQIFRGWDFGLTPACIWGQLNPKGQMMIFDELVSDNMGIDTFGDNVIAYQAAKYASFPFGGDEGDPAGMQRAQTDERTCFEILAGKNINVNPAEQSLQIRIESVRKGLNTLKDGSPALIVHPRCKMLRKGFQGKYRYRRIQVSGEKYSDVPEKNEYSHPHDGLQYLVTKFFAASVRGDKKWDKIKYPAQGIV